MLLEQLNTTMLVLLRCYQSCGSMIDGRAWVLLDGFGALLCLRG